MLDFDKHYGPEGWGYMESLVLKGNDPDIKELALALRGGRPPPSVIRIYLADLLEGKRKRKRGRKRADPSKGFLKKRSLADRVFRWKRVLENRYGKTNAYRVALEKVSVERNLSENTLDKYCYPRK